jgi:hypothetical protein
MDSAIAFLSDNAEWLFSGLGVTLVGAIGWMFRRWFVPHDGGRQSQVSGSNSVNIQIGGNVSTSKNDHAAPAKR